MPGKHFPLTSATRQDIRDALAFTRKRYGDAKAKDYASLIRIALHAIAGDAHAGKPGPKSIPTLSPTPSRVLGETPAISFSTKRSEGTTVEDE